MSPSGRLFRPFLFAALAVAPAGCGGDTALTQVISYETGTPGIQAGYVGITITATGLTVVNQTERPIYLMAINAETLALIDLALCTGGTNCAPLAQGQRREIPWSSVLFYDANAKQFSVMWWNVTVQPDGSTRAENLHSAPINR